MKVLWLVSITIPAAADACGLQAKEIGGGWLSGALGGMTAAPDAPAITVASVDARAETLTVCSKSGVSFALVPTGSVENFSALLKTIAPDLVHIWGTEYAAARTIQQAAQAAGIPVLVGIQGVMVDCALHLNDGVPARLLHSCAAQHLIDRHVPGGLLDVNQARFDTLAQSEAAVLANARHVTGRTSFDRSAVQKLAPQASYYPCNETLRPEFYTPPVWHPRTFGEAPVLLPEDTLLALLRTALYQGRLRTGSADGFDERLCKAVYTAHSFSDAVEKARTRRFPAARVRRALLRSVLGVETDAPVSPAYLRVLALGVRGRAALKQAALPVIVKPATEKRLSDALQPALRRDTFADDLFALALPDPERRIGGGHFRKTPFCLR